MRTFFLRVFEDHGLWSIDGYGCSVGGCTSLLQAISDWKEKAQSIGEEQLTVHYDKQMLAGKRGV